MPLASSPAAGSVKLWVVITTLNEQSTIGYLVDEAFYRLQPVGVVVVDDLSADATVGHARAAGARVVVNPRRLGIGPSLVRGWQFAMDRGATQLLQIDAGGSHDVAEACSLLAALDHGADMALGSRFMRGSAYLGGPWWRPWASRGMAALCNWLTGAGYSDWSSGYRAFTAAAAARLSRCSTMATMHGWQLEVLAWAVSLGMTITEVPITYRAGRSSMSPKVAREALLSLSHIMHHVPPATGDGAAARIEAERKSAR